MAWLPTSRPPRRTTPALLGVVTTINSSAPGDNIAAHAEGKSMNDIIITRPASS
jgi:hypothetical protein